MECSLASAGSPVELIFSAADIVGESAVWSVRDQALWWVDIIGRVIRRLDPATGVASSWPTPDLVTSIGLQARGGYIVALRRDVCLWQPGQEFRHLATPEPDRPDNRLNEGRVGPDGQFWVGTMQNNIDSDGRPRPITQSSGAIHRIDGNGRVHTLSSNDIGLVNTFAWTIDGRLLTADSLANQIYSYRFDGVRLGPRETFGAPFPRGVPDGSCLDAEGFLWNCRVAGGGCVARFAPDGTVDRVIDLPCSWPTSCAFGGPNLDRLFVTSARFTMDTAHLAAHPQEGGLFALRPGPCGSPEYLFEGEAGR
jgi:sugar lactone lactonase YvrE